MASITNPVFNSCLERDLNPTTDHEYENEKAKSDDWRRLSNEFEKGASGYQELQINRERVYQPLASRNSTELVIRPASNEEYVVQFSEVRFQLGEKRASAKSQDQHKTVIIVLQEKLVSEGPPEVMS